MYRTQRKTIQTKIQGLSSELMNPELDPQVKRRLQRRFDRWTRLLRRNFDSLMDEIRWYTDEATRRHKKAFATPTSDRAIFFSILSEIGTWNDWLQRTISVESGR
jgi:hypothetical protein